MNKEENIERIVIAMICVTFCAILIALFKGSAVTYLKEGMQIPSFSIYSLGGKEFSKENFKGKVVLINFWASWCKPCIEEFPLLIRLRNKFSADKMEMLLVNIGENNEEIRKFLQDNKFDIPVYRDPRAQMSKQFGTFKYPETYIVDKNGVLRKKVIGQLNWVEDDILPFMEGLLKEK
ncbi:MAG: hypothetical protein A2Y62_12075 [Candidatus Fischerbacteria bacterium RBG_13_37_8]|uniref:Thioredoxin domain-containing protein n=1 Tax=Candidatus Fischerbacteria bacterium RBG_13_37_8 TaxID=1817863 RepID=A0A1F5VDE1_9BACT|nr:MAG: hypothetical protein A2Y62_12075 [Candidatus Fischerbacteria bacterium RBG_13_37_8]